MLTPDQLHAIMPRLAPDRGTAFFPFLTAAMSEFAIDQPARMAAFLAQLAHESGQLRFMEEIWGPTAAQGRYEPVSTLATNLGNTQPGDGKRFKGRGPIQLTGRANYKRFGDLLGVDLVNTPERAANPDVAFRIAGLFWSKRGLNELADQTTPEAFRQITRRINGGFNGLTDRQRFYDTASQVLGVTAPPRTRGASREALPVDDVPFDRGFEAIRAAATVRPPRRSAKTSRKKTARKTASRKTTSRKASARKKVATRRPAKKAKTRRVTKKTASTRRRKSTAKTTRR